MPELDALPVRELMRLARELGLPRCLGVNGRRADLLAALPMAYQRSCQRP